MSASKVCVSVVVDASLSVYVKARVDPVKKEKWWKITFVNGEQLHTRNQDGVNSIINSMKS